jgi:hypothetical protein
MEFSAQYQIVAYKLQNYTPWPESSRELYWQSDRRLSAKVAARRRKHNLQNPLKNTVQQDAKI